MRLVLVSAWLVAAGLVLNPRCGATYIQTCHYFGDECGHSVGDFDFVVSIGNFSEKQIANNHRNIACGSSPADATQTCLKNPANEPDLDLFQCFSIYNNNLTSGVRSLVAAGCIFNHALELCTGHTCDFSHEIELSRPDVTLLYCCCHTRNECNRPTPTAGTTAVTSLRASIALVATTSPPTTGPGTQSTISTTLSILAILLSGAAVCIIVLVPTCCWIAHKRRSHSGNGIEMENMASRVSGQDNIRQEIRREPIRMENLPSRVSGQDNIRQDIPQLEGSLTIFRHDGSIIGRGRFASVHRGELDGSEVAVKVFSERDETSWKNEWRIYNTLRVQHPNILYFRGAREECNGPVLERYLVTEYHSNGSLSDFLKCNSINFDQLYKMAVSIGHGLEFLHSHRTLHSFIPSYTKPTIAHRDLKSKNILVKLDGECCVSDFGLATHFGVNESLTERQGKVGTMRYMAPEVLEGAISFQMESFLRIDIYAFALVMWELIIRCSFGGVAAQPYREPFYDEVGVNATPLNMLCTVVKRKIRPQFPPHCSEHQGIDNITRIVKECWDPDPEARLSTQCFLDNLTDLMSDSVLQADEKDQMNGNMPPGTDIDHKQTDGGGGQAGASVSAPPAYESGSFAHEGLAPNVNIHKSDDCQLSTSNADPPGYTNTMGSCSTSAIMIGTSRVGNGVLPSNGRNGYIPEHASHSSMSAQPAMSFSESHSSIPTHITNPAPTYSAPPAENSTKSSAFQESSV